MQKAKYITVNQFLKLPLSDAIDQVIYDIQTEFKNTKLDMSSWWKATKKGNLCSVCLGGAAVIAFNKNIVKELPPQLVTITEYDKRYGKIAITFDELRRRNIYNAAETWYGKGFDGIIEKKIKRLYRRKSYPLMDTKAWAIKVLTAIANDLREIGL